MAQDTRGHGPGAGRERAEWIGMQAQDPEQAAHFGRLIDRHLPWIPIHRVRKNRSLCWTHYLCQDGTLKVLKCKHCGGLIAHVGKDRSSTSRFRSHLKHHHRIDPNSDYYTGASLLPVAAPGGAEEGGRPARERRTVLRTELLLGIITAAQDLRADFFENSVVKELLARLSAFETLDLPAAIAQTARDIDDIVARTVRFNERHEGARFEARPGTPAYALKLEVAERVHALSQVTFFALSFRRWAASGIWTWFLNFYDPNEGRQYSLVVDAGVSAGATGEPPEEHSVQLQYPGLGRYVVSYMAAGEEAPDSWNPCIVAELQRSFALLFGEPLGPPPDVVMSVGHVELSNPLLRQVLDFSQSSQDVWRSSLSKFDLTNYSTVTETITSLLKLRPLLDILEPIPFTPANYLDMVHFTNVSQGFNRAFQFFTSAPDQTWIFSLLTVMALSEHLAQTLEEMGSRSMFSNHLEDCVSSISKLRRRLMGRDLYILASFLVPTTLFDDQLLATVFGTESLPKIINSVVDMVYHILKDYFDAPVMPADTENTELDTSAYRSAVSVDSDAEEVATSCGASISALAGDSRLGAENGKSQAGATLTGISTELEEVIKDVIRGDLYAYLNVVNDVVPSWFQVHCSTMGISKSTDEEDRGQYKRNDTPLSPLDVFLDIHVPVAKRFHSEKWNALRPVIRFLLKYMNSQPSATMNSAASFMATYRPIAEDSMLREVLKVKSMDRQFDSTKVDFDHDSLPLVCKYASKTQCPTGELSRSPAESSSESAAL
ncbi:AaceriAFR587Cp [[Ashbya] aceris (nom. inval.)]|nr:AaceriAFR587Cp [[Ashbya] aceris (nom. inval.)]